MNERLEQGDLLKFKQLLKLFGSVFKEPHTYQDKVPNDSYLVEFLQNKDNIVLVSTQDSKVTGGLVAYVLRKFEQNRKEIFVYDLAVSEEYHRKGIATSFFEDLKKIAKEIGAYEIFVQADKGDDAVKFYRTIASNELEAHHFEIKV